MEAILALAYLLVVGVGGWYLVRGRGQGWELLVWLSLLLGPLFGPFLWWMMRRGARMGDEHADRRRSSDPA